MYFLQILSRTKLIILIFIKKFWNTTAGNIYNQDGFYKFIYFVTLKLCFTKKITSISQIQHCTYRLTFIFQFSEYLQRYLGVFKYLKLLNLPRIDESSKPCTFGVLPSTAAVDSLLLGDFS